MSATKDIDTILSTQDLPMELMRQASSHHQSEKPRVASMLSGLVAARNQDEVICPMMLRRNLVVPAHEGAMTRSGWRVE